MRIFPLHHDLWFSFSVCMFRKRLCYLVSQHIFFSDEVSITILYLQVAKVDCVNGSWRVNRTYLPMQMNTYTYDYMQNIRDSCCCGFNAKFANSWEHGLWLENGHRLMCIICEHWQILYMSVGDYLTKSDMNVIL